MITLLLSIYAAGIPVSAYLCGALGICIAAAIIWPAVLLYVFISWPFEFLYDLGRKHWGE